MPASGISGLWGSGDAVLTTPSDSEFGIRGIGPASDNSGGVHRVEANDILRLMFGDDHEYVTDVDAKLVADD